jgi:hypothetical protein
MVNSTTYRAALWTSLRPWPEALCRIPYYAASMRRELEAVEKSIQVHAE